MSIPFRSQFVGAARAPRGIAGKGIMRAGSARQYRTTFRNNVGRRLTQFNSSTLISNLHFLSHDILQSQLPLSYTLIYLHSLRWSRPITHRPDGQDRRGLSRWRRVLTDDGGSPWLQIRVTSKVATRAVARVAAPRIAGSHRWTRHVSAKSPAKAARPHTRRAPRMSSPRKRHDAQAA